MKDAVDDLVSARAFNAKRICADVFPDCCGGLGVKERSLICNAREVRAIQSDAMTQFRRILKPQPQMVTDRSIEPWRGDATDLQRLLDASGRACHYGQPGDRLWVKETWAPFDSEALIDKAREFVFYRADDERKHETDGKWRPSIHMPRWASRLTLEITGVRVERLQDISEADAIAEGWPKQIDPGAHTGGNGGPFDWYRALWESINGPGTWDANPWVWVVEFRRIGQCAREVCNAIPREHLPQVGTELIARPTRKDGE